MSKLKNGWAVGVLADIAFWGSGGTPSRTNSRYYGGQIPWIKTGELGKGLIIDTEEKLTELGLRNSSAKIFPEGSVAIAMYGATIGKVSILGIDAATNQACAVGIPKEDGTTTKYLFYFLLSQKDAFTEAGKGAAQANISQSIIKNWAIPLAPINEQRRIADKLDTWLARVEACRARLERVRVILKRFRLAVLAAATSGELTEDWRIENFGTFINKSAGNSFDFGDADCFGDYRFPSSWKTLRLGDIAGVKAGIKKTSNKKSSSDEVPYLRVANVQRGYFDLSEVKSIPVPSARLEDLLLKPGDILFNEGGDIDKLGRGWVWSGELEHCVFQNHVFSARLRNPHFNPKFFSHYGNSRGIDYFLSYGKQSTNLASISKSVLTALPIVVPPADEQDEIVRRVETLFAFADRLQRHTQVALTKVERLTPALLDKAFRGELVPQDPNDEPASVLLERIRAARAIESNKPKRKRKKQKRSQMSKNSVKKAIDQLPEDNFSFDELCHHLAANYDKLKDIIFALLNETEPSITQLFDESLETMHFVRRNK